MNDAFLWLTYWTKQQPTTTTNKKQLLADGCIKINVNGNAFRVSKPNKTA